MAHSDRLPPFLYCNSLYQIMITGPYSTLYTFLFILRKKAFIVAIYAIVYIDTNNDKHSLMDENCVISGILLHNQILILDTHGMYNIRFLPCFAFQISKICHQHFFIRYFRFRKYLDLYGNIIFLTCASLPLLTSVTSQTLRVPSWQ